MYCGVIQHLREPVCLCRRATELKLNQYLVVGPSIVSDKAGLSDSMIAELFESVRLSQTYTSRDIQGLCMVLPSVHAAG